MIKNVFIFWLAFVNVLITGVASVNADVSELEKKVELLLEQNRALSQKLYEVQKELAELKKAKNTPKEEVGMEKKAGLSSNTSISISGLLEFGGAWQDVELVEGDSESESDLAMTTVELHVDAAVGDLVSAESTLLYEDPTFEDGETSLDIDTATIKVGNSEKYPVYFMAGVMYLPFGALFEHFPDDPLIDAPLTLSLGETREKAVLVGYERAGISLAAYLFNGDVEERGEEDHIENFGIDINYSYKLLLGPHERYVKGTKFEIEPENCVNFLAGLSYISNLADSDGLTDAVGSEIDDYVPGVAAYLRTEYCGYFLEVEYMTALDEFDASELKSGTAGARPSVWNFEAGFNYNWWKNLEVALKYAGSKETEGLGFPESRYGVNFNQELADGITASFGIIHDKYDKDDVNGRDERELLFGQLAVQF